MTQDRVPNFGLVNITNDYVPQSSISCRERLSKTVGCYRPMTPEIPHKSEKINPEQTEKELLRIMEGMTIE